LKKKINISYPSITFFIHIHITIIYSIIMRTRVFFLSFSVFVVVVISALLLLLLLTGLLYGPRGNGNRPTATSAMGTIFINHPFDPL